ncbi:MAG TPA: sensor domain-containing diguanylate cyclase [Acidimicrobiales bacterium]|nr:sensor domain-containing diguanylate cyclase [Acidimicrobiales bacterium]
MEAAPYAHDETGRLLAVRELALAGSPPERRFDRIAQLAARMTGSEIGIVSVVEELRVFFKSATGAAAVGVDLGEPSRDYWFCSHVVAAGAPLVVADARADPRFDRLPAVTGEPALLAYAGVPVRAPRGEHIGALAVMSLEPREYSEAEVKALGELARLVEAELSALPHSTLDGLTGALNSRTFTRLGNRFLELADSRGLPATLLHLDLVGTGAINTALGFDAGDHALVETAQLLGTAVRASDLVGRIGADEFALLLFGSDAGEAKLVIARLAELTREHNEALSRTYPYQLTYVVGMTEHQKGAGTDITAELAAASMLADLRL